MNLSDAYLDLMARRLTRIDCRHEPAKRPKQAISSILLKELERRMPADTRFMRRVTLDRREAGRDWPTEAETMIGLRRLQNLRECIRTVVQGGIVGDFIETGVWRGGAAIFMRAALLAFGDADRNVWLADSFRGLPQVEVTGEERDLGLDLWQHEELAVTMEQVRQNFDAYGLLDERVRFLPGWFHETLPTAPIGQLSIIRLDGDLYSSTKVALDSLYDKLSVGGFVIVDDYHTYPQCRDAVVDFRALHGSSEELHEVDGAAVYWRKKSV